MDENTLYIIHRAKRFVAELLLADIEAAQMVLALRDTTRKKEQRTGDQDMAMRAYSTVAEHLKTGKLLPEDKLRVSDSLRGLRDRLILLGEILPAVD